MFIVHVEKLTLNKLKFSFSYHRISVIRAEEHGEN